MEMVGSLQIVRLNCWEFMNCGRDPGGNRIMEFGVCPAAVESRLDTVHSGVNGGRICWFVDGTLCDVKVRGKATGSYVEKYKRCLQCRFYRYVKQQEQGKLITPADVHFLLRKQ